MLPIALLLLAVGATLVISCVADIDLLDLLSLGHGTGGSPLSKRQSTFTSNKREFTFRHVIIVAVAN